jgi:hypothetical protein
MAEKLDDRFWIDWDDLCDRHSDRILEGMIKDRKETDIV